MKITYVVNVENNYKMQQDGCAYLMTILMTKLCQNFHLIISIESTTLWIDF